MTRLGVLGGSASPIAEPLVANDWVFRHIAAATVLLEIAAPVALLRRFRTGWVAAAWVLHVGIAAAMFVVFPYPLTLIAFAPLYAIERIPTLLWSSRPKPVIVEATTNEPEGFDGEES